MQWPDLNAHQLLSSMQALLIYMLLRIQQGETLYNDFDVLLLGTMWVRHPPHPPICTPYLKPC
jgi:hypothetical protein